MSSTVEDVLCILAQRQIIPANYWGIYTLCYGRVGSLLGSSTMASLGAGSLSHFYLRTRVCGGAGRFLGMFYHGPYLHSFVGHVPESRESSQSSESLAIPMSVKKTRKKRTQSDEDVWEWTDARIIGTYVELVHSPSNSNLVV